MYCKCSYRNMIIFCFNKNWYFVFVSNIVMLQKPVSVGGCLAILLCLLRFFLSCYISYIISHLHTWTLIFILPANLLLYRFLYPSLSHTVCPLEKIHIFSTGFFFVVVVVWRCFGCCLALILFVGLRMSEDSVKWNWPNRLNK